MGSRCYFSIRYVPDYADNELLAGRCISNMHGFLSHERNKPFKNSVGICFPVWNEQTVGNVITFVSTNESILTGLSYQPYFSRMVNENLFEISDIKLSLMTQRKFDLYSIKQFKKSSMVRKNEELNEQ